MPKPTIKSLEKELRQARNALEMLAVSPERDNTFYPGGLSNHYTSRNSWDRREIFAETIRAWRVNPIARRIVRIIRSFILGKGIEITSPNEATQKYLQEWWKHPLNKLSKNVKRWIDEATRTGNLFILASVGEAGTLYVRAIPSESIKEIITQENDVEQEIAYEIDENAGLSQEKYPAYISGTDQKYFIVHFASNQPVGSAWGESDLAPLLVWIGRFSSWLEDRVRLNRYRNAFMFTVNMAQATPTQKAERQAQLNANPPKPGQVLVTDPSEEWDTLSPKLDSHDANTDGLAVKKNILSGLGFPMHWFAEPEGSNRTTAEAAGTPTFRTLEEDQDEFFEWIIELAHIALEVGQKKADSEISISGPDITERDNATLALSVARAFPALAEMFDREGIDDAEFKRLFYKFMAETTDKDNTTKIKRKPLVEKQHNESSKAPADSATDPTDPAEDEE